MQPKIRANCQHATLRKAVAGLMLGLWLGVAALATSPALHHWLHQDSDAGGHECVVTLISKSHLVGGVLGGVLLVVAAVGLGWRVPFEFVAPAVADVRLAPSRAPPLFFLHPQL